jgi:hypothetical protein
MAPIFVSVSMNWFCSVAVCFKALSSKMTGTRVEIYKVETSSDIMYCNVKFYFYLD